MDAWSVAGYSLPKMVWYATVAVSPAVMMYLRFPDGRFHLYVVLVGAVLMHRIASEHVRGLLRCGDEARGQRRCRSICSELYNEWLWRIG